MRSIFNLKQFYADDCLKIKDRISTAKSNPEKRLSYIEMKELLKCLRKMPRGLPGVIVALLILLSILIIVGLIYLYLLRVNALSLKETLSLSLIFILTLIFIRYLSEKYTINKSFKLGKKDLEFSIEYLERAVYELESYYDTLLHQKYIPLIESWLLKYLYGDGELPKYLAKSITESVVDHLEDLSFTQS